jgi:hypothetical protein
MEWDLILTIMLQFIKYFILLKLNRCIKIRSVSCIYFLIDIYFLTEKFGIVQGNVKNSEIVELYYIINSSFRMLMW